MLLEFEISREDYLQASRARTARSTSSRIPQFLSYAACAAGLFLFVERETVPTWLAPAALLGFGAIVAIQRISSAHDALEKVWQEASAAIQPVKLETTDEGLRIHSAHGESAYRWSVIDHFEETRDLFLLYRTRSQLFYYIPKRCLSSAEERDIFRNLLTEKIAPAIRRTGGFPVIFKSDGNGACKD